MREDLYYSKILALRCENISLLTASSGLTIVPLATSSRICVLGKIISHIILFRDCVLDIYSLLNSVDCIFIEIRDISAQASYKPAWCDYASQNLARTTTRGFYTMNLRRIEIGLSRVFRTYSNSRNSEERYMDRYRFTVTHCLIGDLMRVRILLWISWNVLEWKKLVTFLRLPRGIVVINIFQL